MVFICYWRPPRQARLEIATSGCSTRMAARGSWFPQPATDGRQLADYPLAVEWQ